MRKRYSSNLNMLRKSLTAFIIIAPVYQITISHWISWLKWEQYFITGQLEDIKKSDERWLQSIRDPEKIEIVKNRLERYHGVYYNGKDITTNEANIELAKINKRIEKAQYFSPLHYIFPIE